MMIFEEISGRQCHHNIIAYTVFGCSYCTLPGVHLKVKQVARLISNAPNLDTPTRWFVLYILFEVQPPSEGNHSLIHRNVPAGTILFHTVHSYCLVQWSHFIDGVIPIVVTWNTQCVVVVMKIL